jgi:hypothetical protein
MNYHEYGGGVGGVGGGGGGVGGGGGDPGSYIDTNVANYSIHELLDLIGLGNHSEFDTSHMDSIINGLISKYNDIDLRLSRFFKDVRDRILLEFNSNERDNVEGLAMRSSVERGGNNDNTDFDSRGGGGGAEIADGGGGDDYNMGGVADGDYGDYDYYDDGGEGGDDGGEGGGGGGEGGGGGRGGGGRGGGGGNNGFGRGQSTNDIMGLRRDIHRGLVSGDQILKWEQNQYLDDEEEAAKSNGVKTTPYVNRSNKVKIFRDENDHYQMKQKKIGISNSYSVPIAQGTNNPILRNTLSRIINIDSQFRQTAFPYTTDPTSPTSATSFTVVLSEPLTNVTSLRLNSINIPYTWYSVDSALGNNIMYIDLNTGVNGVHTVVVPNGNYTPALLVSSVSRQIQINPYLSGKIDISYNVTNGRCFLFNYTSKIVSFTFYDAAMIYSGKAAGSCRQSTKLNSSLGWLLGFRNSNYYDDVPIAGSGLPTGYNTTLNTFETYGMVYMIRGVTDTMVNNAKSLEAGGQARPLTDQITELINGLFSDNIPTNDSSNGDGWLRSEAIVDCYGPQYFLLIIDDFNHSRVNSGVVGIGEVTTSLPRPAYYNSDLPALCESDKSDINGVRMNKLYVPTVPRTLTFSQLYTLNQITANRSSTTKNREMGPKTSDVFAVIPLRGTAAFSIGQHFIDSGPALLSNQRSYFGPVVINKLRITLRDDKGYIVNLHGNDWSFSLVTEELYEY